MSEKIIESKNINEWEVLTDTGWEMIESVNKTIPYQIYLIKTQTHELKCADNHIIFNENKEEVFVKDLHLRDRIHTDTGIEEIISLEILDTEENMYDVSVKSDNHRYFTSGILSHNTTIASCYLLWYILFHKDKNVAVLAHKLAGAREIVSRIELAYGNLPKWLQQGIKYFNKGSLELENGSKLFGSATSSSAIRGMSISLCYIDECLDGNTKVCIKNKQTNEIQTITLQNLYQTLNIFI